MTITLYDIPSKGGVPWSPNTLKARIALNYKGLEFKTEWIEYPDIEPTMKAIGARPTWKKKIDGSDTYTVPVIRDDATGRVVADSFDIAIYLDETYPDKPILFPGDSRAAIAVFNRFWLNTAMANLGPLITAECCVKLNPRSEQYYRRTREEWLNVKLDEWCPPGPKRVEQWEKMKSDFSIIAGLLDWNGDKPWFFGDTFSFADAIMAGFLFFIKFCVEEDEWVTFAGWDGERWRKLAGATEKLCT